MKKIIVMIIIILMVIVSCAPGPNTSVGHTEEAAGFWMGLWHGFIILFSFIWSWFSDCVNIYEVHNNGFWYNLGFLFGVMAFFGGGGGGACKKRKR